MSLNIDERYMIARRAAKEIVPGQMVHLGPGIPQLVADFVPHDGNVLFHFEVGFPGIRSVPYREERAAPGASFFDSTSAFGMVRKGKLDIAFFGAFQVSSRGDLANWMIPGKKVVGIGGVSELAHHAKKRIVLMSHLNREGKPKIVPECTIPITVGRCVDLIMTERAVMQVTEMGLLLTEVLYPYSLEDVILHTGAPLRVSEHLLVSY